MNIPADLHYTSDHEWIKISDDKTTATIGITDFAQRELGDIVFVEIEDEGTEVEAEGVFGSVEAVKTVSELFAPIAGTISEINADLDGEPELVNSDPYGKGWMVKMTIDADADLSGLLDADAYGAHVG